jgi:hypothetical protein
MKKLTGLLVLILALGLVVTGCKKEGEDGKKEKEKEVALEQQYARFTTWVYQDRALKKKAALLSQAEPVDLLEVMEPEGKDKELARVRLSDGSIGFIQASYLADRPIVFTRETRAHIRNNMGSRVAGLIPPGTIGFIVDEKGDWYKISISHKVEGKWIVNKWVNQGFSDEYSLVVDAKEFNSAVDLLESDKVEEKDIREAMETLRTLSSKTNVIGDLARRKIAEVNNPQSNKPVEEDEPPIRDMP